MSGKTSKITPAITIAAMNRRNFIKAACVATTVLAAGRLTAKEASRRAAPGTGSPKFQDKLKPGTNRKPEDEFKPGDKIPTSGVYDVVHDRVDGDYHAHPHQVTAIAGKVFPRCRGCQDGVRFRLHLAAEHVQAHDLFKA